MPAWSDAKKWTASAAAASTLLLVACGLVAESPATSSGQGVEDAGTGTPAPAPPSTSGSDPADRDAGNDDDPGIGCAGAMRAGPSAWLSDAGSAAASLHLIGDGDITMHGGYRFGAFVVVRHPDPQAACGDRGVYLGEVCAVVSLAACDTSTDTPGGKRSCIYLSILPGLTSAERVTLLAGHYVDAAGRCWSLIDASLTIDPGGAYALGSAASGHFDALAVSGTETRQLSGSFEACRAFIDTTSCE